MWVGANTDIHDQWQAANQLRQNAADMSEVDRRKDEFLAMLGHELRNPLAPISNAVQILRLQRNEAPLQQQAHTIIERQVGQLKHLIDDLQEISRIGNDKTYRQATKVVEKGTPRLIQAMDERGQHLS